MRNNPVVSLLRSLSLFLAAVLAAPTAFALDSGDITVASVKGEVRVEMNGAARAVRAGTVLVLPASVRTGRDGSIDLKQGATTVSVGPDTLLEFPALEKPGAPIDRIQQPRGNAFYNIGKREGRKLRIETPYLVGVVKGTQFNVAAGDEATTISLFEGLLEVRATDDGGVIDLKAGEIAARKRGDEAISVMKMEAGKAPAAAPRPQGGNSGSGSPGINPPRLVSHDPVIAPLIDNLRGTEGSPDVGMDLRAPANAGVVDAGVGMSVSTVGNGVAEDLATNTNVDAGPVAAAVDAGVAVNVDATSVSADVVTGTSIEAGPLSVGVDTGTSVDVGASGLSADVSAGTSIDAGPVSAGVDAGASVDIGASGVAAEVSASIPVDAGPVSAGLGLDTAIGADASGISADLGTGTAVDAGPVTAGLGTDTALDVGGGSTAVAVDAGVALGVGDTTVEVPVGVSAGVDVSTGTVDLGVSVAGADLNLGLDLGLGGSDPTTDTGSSTTTPATDSGDTGTVDVGGLLDGLLRRPGRR